MLIVIHRGVDADAIISAYIYSKLFHIPEDNVITIEQLEDVRDDEITILDIPEDRINYDLLKKNRLRVVEHIDHHYSQRFRSTAEMIREKYRGCREWCSFFDMLVEFANICDTGEIHTLPKEVRMFTLSGIISAMKKSGYSDKTIIKEIFLILDELKYYNEKTSDNYLKNLDNIQILDINGYKVAVVVDTRTHINSMLFEKGIHIIVYSDGNNIGVVRNARFNDINLYGLKEHITNVLKKKNGMDELREWYFHPRGFIVCRGTNKYPVKSPSVLTVWDLVECLKKYLNEYKN